jgi:N-acetylneuraminate synthase
MADLSETPPSMLTFSLDTDSERVYVVAEIGMTHDGKIELARQLTESAIDCGADIVKYQCHIADAETLKDAPTPPYFKGEARYSYFTRTAFTTDQFRELIDLCHDKGALGCISAFSQESVDVITDSGADIIKVPSGEVTNVPLLRTISAAGLPVILSSGMSDWQEIDRAVETLKPVKDLCLVQCSSIYPCPPEKVGLNLIRELKARYGLPVGLSDHSLTGATAVAATALGARVIEKHFTISKNLYGPDARFSLEPEEFTRLVEDIRFISRASKAEVSKDDIAGYAEMKAVFEKSIVIKDGVKKGGTLTMENLAFKKPGTGISASRIDDVLGGVVRKDMVHDQMLSWDDLAE